MTIRKLLFSAGLCTLAFSACDLINKTTAQVTAKKVIVGTVLHTPPIEVRPEAVAGLDASFPAFDGGFPTDSGFTFDAGFLGDGGGLSITVPEQTVVFAFFGTRNGEGLSQEAPTAVTGATMSIQLKGATALPLKEQTAGTFQLSSAEEPKLTYQENGDYLFTASADGQTFVGVVEKVPAQERIAAFRPNGQSHVDLAANSEFTFARPDPPNGQERSIAFVAVVPISREGKQGEPTYTNTPKTPLEYLKLAVAPSVWKTTTVTIPGSAFPDKDKNYLILLQSAKLGRTDTDNLFIGSAMIAGTADVGIVKTH
ncbi:MAG: hypothetical protein H6Q89_2344 [Myxococcaceae bacterium]|nr:hypothetical protein [Myxococcaceae bacterium]